ncbi:hypothetical protein G6F40_016636 [Rhizopus arrhizus]|nr:hypothetical protein G6F40_016636 [Rhizopus arrhizus]
MGPLLGAVVTGDDGQVAHGFGVGGGGDGGPDLGALVVAGAFASGVLVEGVERHARAVDQDAILGLDGLRVGASREQGGGTEYQGGGDVIAHVVPRR